MYLICGKHVFYDASHSSGDFLFLYNSHSCFLSACGAVSSKLSPERKLDFLYKLKVVAFITNWIPAIRVSRRGYYTLQWSMWPPIINIQHKRPAVGLWAMIWHTYGKLWGKAPRESLGQLRAPVREDRPTGLVPGRQPSCAPADPSAKLLLAAYEPCGRL